MNWRQILAENWQRRGPLAWGLSPLALLYGVIVKMRAGVYRLGLLPTVAFPQPVVVVGNLTAGGTGKTPLVAHIVGFLREQGFNPGIVTRGYGGRGGARPMTVNSESDPREMGDEPVLLARRTRCPVVVDRRRPRGVAYLIKAHHCDVIVSDDGLQHLALGRRVEVAVVDGQRGFGNRFYLPAGPLRESPSRLDSVDFVVYNGHAPGPGQWSMTVDLMPAVNMRDPGVVRPLESFAGGRVHAVAGVGNPRRFFSALATRGLNIMEHAHPDHVFYSAADFIFEDDYPILMTEKDAVKCARFTDDRMWFVPMGVTLDNAFYEQLLMRIRER